MSKACGCCAVSVPRVLHLNSSLAARGLMMWGLHLFLPAYTVPPTLHVLVALQVLFPESYTSTAAWLHTVVDPAEDALFGAQQQLLAALDVHPRFKQLASGCVVSSGGGVGRGGEGNCGCHPRLLQAWSGVV